MNKKGFTLIEMLVVIAIIAVLVAIIIPTVSSATDKAKAAADAANLRSLVAEATTDLLAGGDDEAGLVHYKSKAFTVQGTAPKGKSKDVSGDSAFVYVKSDGTVDAYFADAVDVKAEEKAKAGTLKNIDFFAKAAAGN